MLLGRKHVAYILISSISLPPDIHKQVWKYNMLVLSVMWHECGMGKGEWGMGNGAWCISTVKEFLLGSKVLHLSCIISRCNQSIEE